MSGDNLRLDFSCTRSTGGAGAPTLTTPTLTPTTLRNIEQMFLEHDAASILDCPPPEMHENAAHFVPPYVALSRSDDLSMKEDDSGELEANEEKVKIWPNSKSFQSSHLYLPDYSPGSAVLPILIQISEGTPPSLNPTTTLAESVMTNTMQGPHSLTSSLPGVLMGSHMPLPRMSSKRPLTSSSLQLSTSISGPTSLGMPSTSSKPTLMPLSRLTNESTPAINALPTSSLAAPFPGPVPTLSVPLTVPFSGSLPSAPLSSLAPSTSVTLPGPSLVAPLPMSIVPFPVTSSSLSGQPSTKVMRDAISVPLPGPLSRPSSTKISEAPVPVVTLSNEASRSSSNELFFRQLLPEVALRLKMEFPQTPVDVQSDVPIKESKTRSVSSSSARSPGKKALANIRHSNNNNFMNDDEKRRALRRLRNKEAAARCRKRRLDQTVTLQDEVDRWEELNTASKREIEDLKLEQERLQRILESHKEGKCKITSKDLLRVPKAQPPSI